MTLSEIKPSDVIVPERLRKLDITKVSELAESISNIGLLQPIVIDTDNNLLAGNHRLEAIKNLGYKKIECRKINLPEQKRKLVEIDENLCRLDLSIIEKAEHLILKEAILEDLGLRIVRGDNRHTLSSRRGRIDTSALAEKMDLTKRKYQRIKQIYQINATARLMLKNSPIADNLDVLLMIERLRDDGLQLEIAKRVKNGYDGKIRQLIKDIQNEISQNEILAQLDNYESSNDEKVQLYHGDFREASQQIPDNSIDLMFSDPPYLDSIELYKSMSEIGSRVLKDGGSLLCYLTQTELPAVLSVMTEYLDYHWVISIKHGGSTGRHGRGVFVEWKPLLWFVKSKRERTNFVSDFILSEPSGKVYHEWEQSEVESDYYISHLTGVGDIVVDFMMGSGTTGLSAYKLKRKFIGIEKDRRTFAIAKGRITNRDKDFH